MLFRIKIVYIIDFLNYFTVEPRLLFYLPVGCGRDILALLNEPLGKAPDPGPSTPTALDPLRRKTTPPEDSCLSVFIFFAFFVSMGFFLFQAVIPTNLF
jgi:hypothetical protein